MDRSHQTIKIWRSTLTLLKIVSALNQKTMVKTLHSLLKAEADRLKIGKVD